MKESSISYSWCKQNPSEGFASGVSLHGHTCMSRESLRTLAEMGTRYQLLLPLFANRERHCREAYGYELDFKAAYWTPPMPPREALELERQQIEDQLQLPALVSLTDHDDIRAPLMLRAQFSQEVPISLEWTVPYRDSVFHIGVHNLPAATAVEWMWTLTEFTAWPSRARLIEILAELNALPKVLIVFNHPIWDLQKLGAERHMRCVNEFLAMGNRFIHAMELNGLRSWQENREAKALAQRWNQVLISGGDRHGAHANAMTNLTHASSFDEFVHEVRRERISHILFMTSCSVPLKYRILESTLDVIRYYPNHPEGSRNWDDRVFHPDADGVMQPISQLWPGQKRAPVYVRSLLGGLRLLGVEPLSSSLRVAWHDRQELRAALDPLKA